MNDQEFEELLRRHLSDVEALRRMRNADRDRLDAKLRERLRNAERGNLDVRFWIFFTKGPKNIQPLKKNKQIKKPQNVNNFFSII